jgi:D-serine deaminase-like pyridoxal phosphate-dependent protein
VLPSDAVALARRLQPLEHLRVVGVQGYEGNLQHIRDPRERQARCDQAMRRLEQAVETLLADGHAVDVVTTGGTGTAEYCARHPFVTEVQPGSFIFMDADYLATGGLSYVPALTLISTVISHTTPNRAVVDAGLKSLSDDSGPAQLHELPGWTYAHAGDEHGVLTASPGADRAELHIGDRVTLIPSHIDTTVNLHDEIYACRGGAVVGVWPIAARGLVR